jgi:uncharacterized protein (TIGR00288 family)
MPASAEPRVALYFDFDNIVISRYDQLHGEGAYRKDTSRTKTVQPGTQAWKRLQQATVDIDAVLDFAATFGTIAIARAYADWSTPVNASYRNQLIDRAVDLVQLFPLSATKNGADIRLSVDAIEDLFLIENLSNVVIVAGDSDYVALAQKTKKLGRYVVGIGVAGGTSRALTAACDEYADYDAILATDAAVRDDEASDSSNGVAAAAAPEAAPAPKAKRGRAKSPAPEEQSGPDEGSEAADGKRPSAGSKRDGDKPTEEPEAAPQGGTRNPGRLLLKALELLRAKNDEE